MCVLVLLLVPFLGDRRIEPWSFAGKSLCLDAPTAHFHLFFVNLYSSYQICIIIWRKIDNFKTIIVRSFSFWQSSKAGPTSYTLVDLSEITNVVIIAYL